MILKNLNRFSKASPPPKKYRICPPSPLLSFARCGQMLFYMSSKDRAARLRRSACTVVPGAIAGRSLRSGFALRAARRLSGNPTLHDGVQGAVKRDSLFSAYKHHCPQSAPQKRPMRPLRWFQGKELRLNRFGIQHHQTQPLRSPRTPHSEGFSWKRP